MSLLTAEGDLVLTVLLQACQQTGWKERGHKEDCKVLKECKGFFERDWTRFDGFFKFPL